ncbi:MAG: pentalenene synthase [Pirellulaceae bacterium]
MCRFALIAAGVLTVVGTVCGSHLATAADQALDVDETQRSRMILHFCEADGTPIRPLIDNVDLRNKYDRQGTPDVSADGLLVAYDAWSTTAGDWQDARIIVANLDGSSARDISDGVMPSFSPDGKRIVVSRVNRFTKVSGAKGQSIWIMDVDGGNATMVADQGAWGARWSRDGKLLVYFGGVDDDGKKSEKNHLRIYDLETKKSRDVFTAEQSPFTELVHHFNWAKGTERLVVFGGQLKRGGSATGIVDVDNPTHLKLVKDDNEVLPTAHGLSVDFHPAGDHVLVTGIDGGRPVAQALKLTQDAKTIELKGLPPNVGVRDSIFTPDGQNFIGSFHSL